MRIRIGCGEIANRPFLAQRALEFRPLALGKVQTQAHRIGNGQNVGKQNCRIQAKARQRLQRDFGGVIRVLAQGEKITGAGARLVVLG